MKIVILSLLFVSSIVFSQDSKDRPSWHEEMPERNEAPEIDIDIDTSLDSDMELDLGLGRRSDIGSSESEEDQQQDSQSSEQNSEESRREQERLAAEKQAEEEKRLEQERLAAEQQAEEEKRQEQERLAAEQQAEEEKRLEQERLAVEQQAEEEKRLEQERLAAENKAAEEKLQEESLDDPAEVTEAAISENTATSAENYTWEKTKTVLPDYPPRAFRKNQEGWVDVEITIDTLGNVTDARPVKSYRNKDTFNDAAIKAVLQWKFEAPANFGINNSLSSVVRIVFEL